MYRIIKKISNKQEKENMKTIIKNTNNFIISWINNYSWPLNSKKKGVLRRHMEMMSNNRRTTQILYENFGYLKEEEFNLYVKSL